MATATRSLPTARYKLGPRDAGRALTWEEFHAAEFEERGYRYELIRGKLVVAAVPNARHSAVWQWIYTELLDYTRQHPEVANLLSPNCEVVIPDVEGVSAPQPDIGIYRDFPMHRLDEKGFS